MEQSSKVSKKANYIQIASWSPQYGRMGATQIPTDPIPIKRPGVLKPSEETYAEAKSKNQARTAEEVAQQKHKLKQKLRAANRGERHFHNLSNAVTVLHTHSHGEAKNSMRSSPSNLRLEKVSDGAFTNSNGFETMSQHLQRLSSAANSKGFRMPVNGVPGWDLEMYRKKISQIAMKKAHADKKKPLDDGIRYICGIPQPPKREYGMVSKSSKPLQFTRLPLAAVTPHHSVHSSKLPLPQMHSLARADSKAQNIRHSALRDQSSKMVQTQKDKDFARSEFRYDEESVDSDDDFIDDTPLDEEDWKRELRSITKYIPSKFTEDTVECMESNFNEICREERITKYIGDKEDEEEEVLQREKAARKELKKHGAS